MENLVKRIMVKCIPREMMKPFALHLESAITFQQARKLIMQQMHDEIAGMLEGESPQPLYKPGNTENKEEEEEEEDAAKKAEDNWVKAEEEYWAVHLKGKKGQGGEGKGGNGKGTGCGERWNCGAQGHPSGECPSPGKLHCGFGAGTAAAMQGIWKHKRKGYGKGKGNCKGKGKDRGKTRLNMAWEM